MRLYKMIHALKMKRASTTNKKLMEWVNKMAKLCAPERIVWIDGSQEQKLVLVQ